MTVQSTSSTIVWYRLPRRGSRMYLKTVYSEEIIRQIVNSCMRVMSSKPVEEVDAIAVAILNVPSDHAKL